MTEQLLQSFLGRVGIGLIFQFFLGMDDARCYIILTALCVCDRERERERERERKTERLRETEVGWGRERIFAAAKSLQWCPTPCYPIDSSPLGSPVPGILQARTLERVAISFSNA